MLFQHIAKFKAGTIKGLPAKIGKERINNHAVINTAHTKRGNLSKVNPGALIFMIVTTKLIAPNKEEIPAKCKLKIDKSTAGPK